LLLKQQQDRPQAAPQRAAALLVDNDPRRVTRVVAAAQLREHARLDRP